MEVIYDRRSPPVMERNSSPFIGADGAFKSAGASAYIPAYRLGVRVPPIAIRPSLAAGVAKPEKATRDNLSRYHIAGSNPATRAQLYEKIVQLRKRCLMEKSIDNLVKHPFETVAVLAACAFLLFLFWAITKPR